MTDDTDTSVGKSLTPVNSTLPVHVPDMKNGLLEQQANGTAAIHIYKYDCPEFVPFLNSIYTGAALSSRASLGAWPPSPEAMQKNVEWLVGDGGYTQDSIKHILWGADQKFLAEKWNTDWPNNTRQSWDKSVRAARASLATVANHEKIGFHDGPHPPKNRCDLLDALVQRCFNHPAAGQARPGIPMVVDLSEKPATDSDKDKHDIAFHWVFDKNKHPILLFLTMICPYGA